MGNFVDDHEQELAELFEENSTYAGDLHAVETFLAHLDNIGTDDMDDAEEVISDFDDNYRGTADSESDFAAELSEELGELADVPDHIKYHIDWDSVWDSELRFDVDSYELPNGKFGFVWVH